MKMSPKIAIAAFLGVLTAALALTYPARIPGVSWLAGQHRPAARSPTLTTLPPFPGYPLYAN